MVLCQWSHLFLHGFDASFHKAVLPGTAWSTGAQCYVKSCTRRLVAFTQVLTATVTMQDARARVGSQCLNEGDVRQATAMVGAQLPAEDLAGREIHDECQVIHPRANTEIRKVLCSWMRN